jgi:hypothetical protein
MDISSNFEKDTGDPSECVQPLKEDIAPTRPVLLFIDLMRATQEILDDISDATSDESDDDGDENESDDKSYPNTIASLESIEAWQALEQMIGQGDIKERVRLLHHRAVDSLAQKEKALPPQPNPLTCIFLGPTVTRKTTVAGLYARILHHLGFVKSSSGERGPLLIIRLGHSPTLWI